MDTIVAKYRNVKLIDLKCGVNLEDAKFIYECFQDYNARKYFSNSMKTESFESFVKNMKSKLLYKYNNFAIIKSVASDNNIGFIYSYEYNANDGKMHVTVYIRQGKRNNIYGVEGCLAFYDYLFNRYSIRKIYCSVMEFNKTSIDILEALEFKLEGVLRKHKYLNGEYYDVNIYALYKEDFKKIKEKFKK